MLGLSLPEALRVLMADKHHTSVVLAYSVATLFLLLELQDFFPSIRIHFDKVFSWTLIQ